MIRGSVSDDGCGQLGPCIDRRRSKQEVQRDRGVRDVALYTPTRSVTPSEVNSRGDEWRSEAID